MKLIEQLLILALCISSLSCGTAPQQSCTITFDYESRNDSNSFTTIQYKGTTQNCRPVLYDQSGKANLTLINLGEAHTSTLSDIDTRYFKQISNSTYEIILPYELPQELTLTLKFLLRPDSSSVPSSAFATTTVMGLRG